MAEALRANTGKKVLICNLMTKWGETHRFTASDMVGEVLKYSGLEKFDYVICNTNEMPDALVSAYEKEKKYPMRCDERLAELAEHVVTGDFYSEADIARHDPEKVARVISQML
jgi:uncharacterized cofD-like protein